MPQGGYRGAEELGTGTHSGDKPPKGTIQTFAERQAVARSRKIAQQLAMGSAVGGMVGASAPKMMPTPPVATPLKDEASSTRERLRMQIATEQQGLLAGRRAGTIARGGDTDATSLANIARLRQEMAGYDRAANPVQRPNTPEQNLNANRSVAGQAAGIMSRDLAAMEQKVYTMPPGPMRDAEVEKIRSFKGKIAEQVNTAGVLSPNEIGPSTPGYSDAMAQAESQTANQVAGAGRNYDRRQNELAFAKEQTAKRMAEEQRTRDVKDAAFNAGMATIRRPEDEFRMKQDAMAAEIADIQAKTGVSKAQAEKIAADTAVAQDTISDKNPARRLAGLQGDAMVSEMNRRNNVANGTARPQTPEEMAAARNKTAFAKEMAGADDESVNAFMQAATELKGAVGGPNSNAIVSNGAGALKASSVMLSTAQALKDLASNPDGAEAAQAKARQLLGGMGVPASGQFTSGSSFMQSMGKGLTGTIAAVPSLAADVLTGGEFGLTERGIAASQIPFEMDTANKQRAAQNLNTTIALLKQIAGQ